MSQTKAVDYALEQFISARHIRSDVEVAYWRGIADELAGYAIAWLADHPPSERWVDDPHH